MKILMTTDSVGGVWTYSLELIRGLAAYGIDVALASMGRPLTAAQRKEAGECDNAEIFESRYRLEWMEDPWDDVRSAGRWLLGLRDRIQPDLVHLNNYAHGHLDWKTPVLMVGHSCVCSWMQAVRGGPAGSEWDEYRTHVRRGLRSADCIVAPTEVMLGELKRHYGLWTDGLVIHNGRSAHTVADVPKEPFVLTAGRLWDEAKNVQLLAQIADQVRWPILVAGHAEHPDGNGRVGWENVQMLGHLSQCQLQEYMARAGIYALPAKYEPFGLTPLEAALGGCPLVLGDIGTLREVWGDAAVFVAPDSPQDWAQHLNGLIDDPARRRQLSERARQRASEYSTRRMAAQYFHTYRRLVQHHDFATARQPKGAAV